MLAVVLGVVVIRRSVVVETGVVVTREDAKGVGTIVVAVIETGTMSGGTGALIGTNGALVGRMGALIGGTGGVIFRKE